MNKSFNVTDLAILGGNPSFSRPLHVNAPNIQNQKLFEKYAESIFESGWLSNSGPLVQKLEKRLAEYSQVDHCVVTCNGTAAMSIVISALELTGEVILPSFNFISTAHSLIQHGIKPIFCDVDLDGNMSPSICENLISPMTSAIIATHLWGNPCEIETLEKIAKDNNVYLLFDAAHAFSCTYRGNPIGRFGDAEIFSFHATKSFHTFEGGAVSTNNNGLADKLRKIKNYGFTGYDQIECVGTNAKMTEICAAMGLANLDRVEETIAISLSNYQLYDENLRNISGIDLMQYNANEINNYHYIVTKVDENNTGFSRDQLINILHAENIIARRYFFPGNHKMEPYKKLYPAADNFLPETNKLCENILLLPGGAMVSHDQINIICQLLISLVTLPVKNKLRQASLYSPSITGR